MNDIKDLFKKSNAKKIALESIENFKKNANSFNIEVEFDIKNGKMVSGTSNTCYFFNSSEGSFSRNFIKALHEVELTTEITNQIETFQKKIKSLMENLIDDEFKDVLRKGALGDAEKFLFPLNTIKVVNFEINPSFNIECDGGYVLQINRMAPKGYVFNKSIANELIQLKIQTGKDFDDLIKEKKEVDPEYAYVSGYTKRYYDGEFSFKLWVDYSPAEFEKVKQHISESLKNGKS